VTGAPLAWRYASARIEPARFLAWLTARLRGPIVEQAGALGLALGPIKRVRAGLRPYRPEVRLERAGRIIHNYGHGGAGYTLSRGCAASVAARPSHRHRSGASRARLRARQRRDPLPPAAAPLRLAALRCAPLRSRHHLPA
jgi:hypothetical protein